MDTIEAVLLYHVVAGTTLTSPKVIKAAKKGTKLVTAQGGTVKVKRPRATSPGRPGPRPLRTRW